jgi:hypothetical protein
MTKSDLRVQIEKWFIRQGLPLFVDGYGAQRPLRRAILVIALIWGVEALVLAPNRRYPVALDVAAAVAGLGIVFGASFLVAKLIDRRRPAVAFGWGTATFVLAPALVPLIFGWQLQPAALTVVFNVGLLVLLYLLLGGIIPLGFWAAKEAVGQTFRILHILARTLPVLFVGVTLLFLTAEVWQMAANLDLSSLLVIAVLFIAIGTLCLVMHLIGEVASCCNRAKNLDWDKVVDRVKKIKSSSSRFRELAVTEVKHQPPNRTTPSLLQRINIGVVLLLAESLQVLAVSLVLGGFFLVFGLLAIPEVTAERYLGGVNWRPMDLPQPTLLGRPIVLTRELLNVTIFIIVFSYLLFVFHAVTQPGYIKKNLRHIDGRIAEALAVRELYLATLWASKPRLVSRDSDYLITFEVPAALGAKKAVLCGRRNGGPLEEHDMNKQSDGKFTRTLPLPPGTQFQYHYVVDDRPRRVLGADEYVPGEHGIEEAVLRLDGAAEGGERRRVA